MSRKGEDAESAMKQLVRALVGHDDSAANSLARRVLASQLGGKNVDVSTCWRRISRKANDSRCKGEVERVYQALERHYSNEERDIPPKILSVMTKLMGKKIQRPAPFRGPSPSLSSWQSKTSNVSVNKAAQQQQIRQERGELEVEEAIVLRECLYSLQGIDGERIKYYHKDPKKVSSDVAEYEGVRVQSPALANPLLYSGRAVETKLGTGAVDALRISAEAGWLYNRTHSYIQQVQRDEGKGVIARAFSGTLSDELREYHSLLTSYESKLSDLSLRQLMVDLRMPTSRLKILAMLTDGLKDFSGGHLLSALHKHSLHGDTRHLNLVQGLLCKVSQPWYDILYRWTTHGVLSDPHNEFFVVELPDVDDKFLWKEKYEVNASQIPIGILDEDLVMPAFNVGKGINFIRRCLHDGKWTMKSDDKNSDLGYRYKPNSDSNAKNHALRKTLKKSAELVHTHILHMLKEEYHMMHHLFALKQFLFLGQGDFFSALVDGLFSEFSGQKGIVGIYKHSLLAIVEGALRSTNAKSMPQFVLDRLQVEVLLDAEDKTHHMFGDDKTSEEESRTVWDIFMLDYKVPDPLIAVVSPAALDKYKMVFTLLFDLKKVEFMLNYTWRQSATLQHALHTTAQYNGIDMSVEQGYLQATSLLRKISILRQSMMHLIVNLKSYLMFEVLEGGWQKLVSDIEAAKTLDEVIDAHDAYLNGIIRKSLLKGDDETKNQQHLADQVEALLAIIGDFSDLQEALFREALLLADDAAEKRMQADARLREGNWGFDSNEGAKDENYFGLANEEILGEIDDISEIYNENTIELLDVLGAIVNGDSDAYGDENVNRENSKSIKGRRMAEIVNNDLDPQRFLIAQLDHNQYYGSQAA